MPLKVRNFYGLSTTEVFMGALTTEERDKLPDSDFALPKTRDYPIHDREHAIDALARASGNPEEVEVRAAVHKRYPDIEIKKMSFCLSAPSNHSYRESD